jgi:NAD(P)-dependent dehydrogenase (short-subunit alcohol dehydrogenase family)
MLKNHVALVTGVSSGIGRATAELLAEHGIHVFGTMRRLGENAPSGVEILPLDVRDDASVRSCVDRVLGTAGRIDLLVNNAGVALYGALEEVSMEQARALFETNFFGVLRMTNAVLPIMREQGRGRIVNIGSVVGFLPIPFAGIYVAGKHALVGYSDTLRLEARPFGIHVSLIEPSFIRTDIDRRSVLADRLLAAYDDQRQRAIEALRRSVETGDPPTMVAHAVLRAATSRNPRRRYLVGRDARVLCGLRTLLPPGWFELGLRRRFRLG